MFHCLTCFRNQINPIKDVINTTRSTCWGLVEGPPESNWMFLHLNSVIMIMISVKNVFLSDNSGGNYSSCGVCLSVWEGEFFIHRVPRRLRADWSLFRVFPHQSCDDLATVGLKPSHRAAQCEWFSGPRVGQKKGPWKIVDVSQGPESPPATRLLFFRSH